MNPLNDIKQKIITSSELQDKLTGWRGEGKRIVFTNGCFDLLHRGHIEYLAEAASLGDNLVIGLNSDESVQLLDKGEGRPIQDEGSRALILAALSFVSAVVSFKEETPLELIQQVQPDVLVKGGDWKAEEIIGAEYANEVKVIPFVPGYSTTAIEERIVKSRAE